ncbi:MAG: FAD-dependent oxidoreductase [Bacillota bacterium]|nr:FAD-dependent oxidoreductase [Bacillota bacterium]
MYDVIIVGGGPAGLTAALYALRAGKSVLVIEKATFGGQITWSPKVENFPTIESISGSELGDRLMQQVENQGGETEFAEVVSVELDGDIKRVTTDYDDVFEGKALIIATGAKPRTLGVEREEELVGNGVCYCAVCDGAFYKGKTVAVNGGGNSALQDAVLLSEGCSKVYLIHRRDSFRGEAKLVELLEKKSNVEFVLNSSVTALKGEEELTGISLEDKDGNRRDIAVDGLFVAVGHGPDNGIFAELMALDEKGYADSAEDCKTKTPGVFVAGDCRKKTVRQLTTACADGSAAALAACSYIDSL